MENIGNPSSSAGAAASKSVHLAGFAPALAPTTALGASSTMAAGSGLAMAGGEATEIIGGAGECSMKGSGDDDAIASNVGVGIVKQPASPKKTTAKKTKTNTKRKHSGADSAAAMAASKEAAAEEVENSSVIRPLPETGPDFRPLTLAEIQSRLKALMDKLPRELPAVPEDIDDNADTSSFSTMHQATKSFASHLQTTVEEFNLLLALVSAATYKWGVDRSGASQQNLAVMSAELQQCQEVISSVVSTRLSNVLCPAVDILVAEVEICRSSQKIEDGAVGDIDMEDGDIHGQHGAIGRKKRKLVDDHRDHSTANHSANSTHKERRINHYTRPLVDPNYVHLCHQILGRNAPLIRQVVATCIESAQKVIGDYLKAMKKDLSHEDGVRGYAF